jgi:hypothetical protein
MLLVDTCLDIQENQIFTKYNCQITINFDDYEDDEYSSNPTYIEIPGIVEVYFPELEDYSTIILPYNIKLNKTPNTFENDDECTINYEKGDLVAYLDYVTTSNNSVRKLLQGKVKYLKDPKSLLMLIHSIMNTTSLNNFELIVSNMMRDEEGNPCRISGNYKNANVVGQTELTKDYGSWLSSLSYRNFDQAVGKALIKQEDIENNPIEKVLTNFSKED